MPSCFKNELKINPPRAFPSPPCLVCSGAFYVCLKVLKLGGFLEAAYLHNVFKVMAKCLP